jgi:hypothetical protein
MTMEQERIVVSETPTPEQKSEAATQTADAVEQKKEEKAAVAKVAKKKGGKKGK